MEEAISLSKIERDLHAMAYLPLHKYVQQILPFLEQRQEAAKRYIQIRGKNEEHDKNFEELIRHINNSISEILNLNKL